LVDLYGWLEEQPKTGKRVVTKDQAK
jgi:hypothetical protein